MDRSTQVNFPIVQHSSVDLWKKAIRRHQNIMENERGGSRTNSPHNTWNHIRTSSPRPRSLNNPAELFLKQSRMAFHSSDNSLSLQRLPTSTNSQPDFFAVTLRDKISTSQSTQSTITSTNNNNRNRTEVLFPPFQQQPTYNTTKNYNYNAHINQLENMSIKSGHQGVTCLCGCSCPVDNIDNLLLGEKRKKEKTPPFNGVSTSTPEGLSWRRLHMSRAKLKATATTSELLSGFAMVAMVELQINEPTNVPEWLFVMFAVCTTVLVAVHIFALMISTYILPNIDAISKLDVSELVAESPHERMRGFIELAWAFSTILGLFLFLVEIAILCWVKFWDYSFTAAIAATIIVIPVLVIFVLFAMHFYHSLVVHRCDTSVTDMETLENMKRQLDEVATTSPV